MTIKKASEFFSKYFRDKTNDDITNFESFRLILKFTNNTYGWLDSNLEVVVLLKYLSNCFWTLEMPLINCKINLMLKYSAFVNSTVVATIATTVSKLYLPVITLSIHDNAKLRQNEVFK